MWKKYIGDIMPHQSNHKHLHQYKHYPHILTTTFQLEEQVCETPQGSDSIW